MPRLNGILETALYTRDMAAARTFYEDVLGLAPMFSDDRLTAYAIERDVLLLFRQGTTDQPVVLSNGTIPGHGGSGGLHVAFAVSSEDLEIWIERLRSRDIAIEGRNNWPRGGRSIYFRDPDGNLLELASPGLWSVY